MQWKYENYNCETEGNENISVPHRYLYQNCKETHNFHARFTIEEHLKFSFFPYYTLPGYQS